MVRGLYTEQKCGDRGTALNQLYSLPVYCHTGVGGPTNVRSAGTQTPAPGTSTKQTHATRETLLQFMFLLT